MYVISKNDKYELMIKNSRFITLLFKIENKEDIEKILIDIKKEYPKATHYCYAYITHQYKKSSDDKEPSGTAGIPILTVLEKENLTNVLAVVVRYFGGIKLGAGGLVRAYSKGIKETIKRINKIPLIEGLKVQISFNYSNQKEIDYLLKDSSILKKVFQDKIFYTCLITSDTHQKILQNKNIDVLKEEKVWIEKTTNN